MKRVNPVIVNGTTGLILIAVLHIFMAAIVNMPAVNSVFAVIYLAYTALVVNNAMQTNSSQKLVKVRVPVRNNLK